MWKSKKGVVHLEIRHLCLVKQMMKYLVQVMKIVVPLQNVMKIQLFSNCSSGKTYKTPIPYASTEDECCEDKKCGDWTGECPDHKKRKGAGEPGDSESQCCINKTCNDVKSDGTCPAGKSVTRTAPRPPENYEPGDYDSTCCTDIKCGSPDSTFKTEAGCNVTVRICLMKLLEI